MLQKLFPGNMEKIFEWSSKKDLFPLWCRSNSKQQLPVQYNFWDLEKIVQCEIRTSWLVRKINWTSTNLLIRSPTSTTLWTIFWKLVLVEIVLMETAQGGTPCNSKQQQQQLPVVLYTVGLSESSQFYII